MRSFRYSVGGGALLWSAEFRGPVEIGWHPQPFLDRIEAPAGLRWNDIPVDEVEVGPWIAPGRLSATGPIRIAGRRTLLPTPPQEKGRQGRRRHLAVVGASRRRLDAVLAVQAFYDRGCAEAATARLRDAIDYERFHDQPHFTRVFRSVTGRTPSEAVADPSPLVEALMSATYNALGARRASVTA